MYLGKKNVYFTFLKFTFFKFLKTYFYRFENRSCHSLFLSTLKIFSTLFSSLSVAVYKSITRLFGVTLLFLSGCFEFLLLSHPFPHPVYLFLFLLLFFLPLSSLPFHRPSCFLFGLVKLPELKE